MLLFDASIDLGEHNVPPGMAPVIAVERAREALQALTGAGWITVEWCDRAPDITNWVRAYRGGSAELLPGPASDAVHALLKMTVRKALFPGLTMVHGTP